MIVVGPLGFEGALANSYSPIHRHDFCLSSAAILSFFVSLSASLAGAIRHEPKRSKMSPLRKTITQRAVEGAKRKCSRVSKTTNDRRRQMQDMRRHPSLQRWKTLRSRGRRISALLMPRLRLSILSKTRLRGDKREPRNQVSTLRKSEDLGTWTSPKFFGRQKEALHMQSVWHFLRGNVISFSFPFFVPCSRRFFS